MSQPDLRDILLKLCRRENLTRDEAQNAFEFILGGGATDAEIGGMLVGLAAKGTTADELIGAATVLRQKAVPLECDNSAGVILDTCGTGGDIKGTFNISTAAALIAAGAGVHVVKHGNRSATSRSGSADVLERLGVRLDLEPARQAICLKEAGICFAFARTHHPVLKRVAAVRQELGIPTIFNMLGPLGNPARARHQLLGVFDPELTERFAHVLKALGSERAWVVHAEDGLDEVSTMSATRISELRDGTVQTTTLDPRSLGLAPARLEDLQVADVGQSADAMNEVLSGKTGPRRDIAALNAAAALVVAGMAGDLPSGLLVAQASIDSGRARAALDRLIKFSHQPNHSALP